MIEVESVCKKYDLGGQIVAALDDVSLTIQQGEMAAITGPSGPTLSCSGRCSAASGGK